MMTQRIIVDTSVWILFLNSISAREVDILKKAILDNNVYLCPIIIQEVLQGIRDDNKYDLIKDYLTAFDILAWDSLTAAIHAAELYRSLRKKGITIRKSNDCLIAAFAQKFELSILHKDRDFSMIAKSGAITVI